MSYNIETRSVSEFVTDSKIKLPRFQRKSIWTAKQNFELAISVFQEYPVGVVIINDEGHTSWLLDGRQRRTALKELRANPDLVYDWARKYIQFKPNEPEDQLKEKFWDRVDAYLQREDDDEEIEHNDNEDAEDSYLEDINGEYENNDIDKSRQKKGLKILLEMILMAHQRKSNTGKWERIFDLQKFIFNPSYAPKREAYQVNPIRLRQFLLDFNNNVGEVTIENFYNYMDDNGGVKDGQEMKFRQYLDNNWDDIKKIIEVIGKSEQIFIDARIGVILLKNVTPLDAQNIFSRINSGGTQLKAEELLSAKPFWNERVEGADSNMLELVQNMYKNLGVEVPEDGEVVRWDYGATLISRIKDKHLLFDECKELQGTKDVDMSQVTLGFKLMSSYFNGGMSAVVVNELEKNKDIKWGRSIDSLIQDINQVCDILLHIDFFRILKSWNKSIYKLMGSAIVLEFITILMYDWKEKGEPITSSGDLNNFSRDAKCLFDRLVFEYAIGAWKGSGDSKMARHIKNWKERIKPLDTKDWMSLIENSATGFHNGQSLDIKHLTPIICYQYALQKRIPEDTLTETSEVDHIIPQAKLSNNTMIPSYYKDALFNLCLLPKSDNNLKKDKSLIEINDMFLKQSISKYTGIPESEFSRYSDVSKIEELKSERIELLKKVFGEIRLSELTN